MNKETDISTITMLPNEYRYINHDKRALGDLDKDLLLTSFENWLNMSYGKENTLPREPKKAVK